MQKPEGRPNVTREAVLAELTELAEGRHPVCQSIGERFVRSEEWKQASKILGEAIHQESFRRGGGELPAPAVWLLPL
jgi:hypothetical protein